MIALGIALFFITLISFVIIWTLEYNDDDKISDHWIKRNQR